MLSSPAASANASLWPGLFWPARRSSSSTSPPRAGRGDSRTALSDVLATTTGKSLLYVTHRLDELAAFDEVDVIDNGRVVGRSVP